jgi:hypothetical protein
LWGERPLNCINVQTRNNDGGNLNGNSNGNNEEGFDPKSMQQTNEVITVGNGTHEAAKGVGNIYGMATDNVEMMLVRWS